jgi:hypothetical protein
VPLIKFQIAPRLRPLMSSGSKEKRKDPRQICLSVARASHSHSTWAEVPSPAPHLLHKGLSTSPIMWRCLLRVLCPVGRPVSAVGLKTPLIWGCQGRFKARNLCDRVIPHISRCPERLAAFEVLCQVLCVHFE